MSGCHDTNISKSSLIIMLDEKIKELKDKVQALSYYSANQIDENQNIHNRIDVLKGKIKDQLKDIDKVIEINKCLIERVDNIDGMVENHEEYLNRIHKIELCDPDKVNHNNKVFKEKIEKIEKWIEEHKKESNAFFMKMEERDNLFHAFILRCESKIKELERFQEVTHLEFHARNKKPHTCPICKGEWKKVPLAGYYECICESCDKGIIWE